MSHYELNIETCCSAMPTTRITGFMNTSATESGTSHLPYLDPRRSLHPFFLKATQLRLHMTNGHEGQLHHRSCFGKLAAGEHMPPFHAWHHQECYLQLILVPTACAGNRRRWTTCKTGSCQQWPQSMRAPSGYCITYCLNAWPCVGWCEFT